MERQSLLVNIAKQFWDSYSNVRGFAGVKDICVPDCPFDSDVFPFPTVEGYTDYAQQWYPQLCPGTKFEYISGFSNDNQAVLHLSQTCTHTGEGLGSPNPPTGKTATVQYIFIFTFNEDNKITKLQKIFNQYNFFEDLGWPQPRDERQK